MDTITADPTSPARPSRFLINREFRLLFTGAAISMIGDQIFYTTLILWIAQTLAYQQSWAPLAVSGVLLASTAPILLVGSIAGVFVDRWDHRRTMLRMDAARTVLIGLLIPLAGLRALPFAPGGRVPSLWLLGAVYAVVLLATGCTQFFTPARMALLGDLVPEEQRTRATGLMQSTMGFSVIIGPALAAPLFFSVGPAWALGFNALSFAGSFVLLLAIRVVSRPRTGKPAGVRHEFAAGIAFFFRNSVLRTLLLTGMLIMLGAGALNALDVFFVTTNLHTPLTAYGALEAAFGVGALAGALLLSIFAARLGTARVFGVSVLVIGLLLVAYSRLTSLWPAIAVILGVGICNAGVNIATGPLVLHVTPREMVGRVMAVLSPLMNLASLLSIVGVGYLASTVMHGFHATLFGVAFGPYDSIFGVGGLLCVLGGLYAMLRLRGVHLAGERGAAAEQRVEQQLEQREVVHAYETATSETAMEPLS